MPEEPTPAPEPIPDPEPKPAEAKPEIDWKAEARKHEQRAKENAAAAAELAALKESQKTEAQKLADRVAQAEKERDDARIDALRVRVGAAKKLPADVVELLQGDTEEELAAHADRLAEHFKQAARPSGSADQGQRGSAPPAGPAQDFADFINKQLNQAG
jgi:hypothetical protein